MHIYIYIYMYIYIYIYIFKASTGIRDEIIRTLEIINELF